MATIARSANRTIDYPTSDGKPMAETDAHKRIMIHTLQAFQDRFADDPMVYVSGDLLLFYEEGNRRKHVAPDVFLVRGVPKLPERDHYLTWVEGRGPELVVEITSKTTRREDQTKKHDLYRDVLKVAEYFLFDPFEDYLNPSLQGYRLGRGGRYVAIAPLRGRLPSNVLGLHLERQGEDLRLFDPLTGKHLPTRAERAQLSEAHADTQEARAKLAEARAELLEARAKLAESEIQRLRLELELARRPPLPTTS